MGTDKTEHLHHRTTRADDDRLGLGVVGRNINSAIDCPVLDIFISILSTHTI